MCLVLIAWQQHDYWPLVAAGNRDEFHQRPTKELHFWPDKPGVAAGRDLQAAGTWLAISRAGRFATVTNFHDAEAPHGKLRSRGHLVTGFVEGQQPSLDYLSEIEGAEYAGFNLLVSDGETLAWLSNRAPAPEVLPPGVYGLSNALLDSPWHKVRIGKAALNSLIESKQLNRTELMRILGNRHKAPAGEIKTDRLPFDRAHAISAPFIVLPDYGTRSSSVVLAGSGGDWQIHERRFDPDGNSLGETSLRFRQGQA